jgi:NAD(P)-dependent dehydrogenase (short-subunit alcohol dehydrogenase family)
MPVIAIIGAGPGMGLAIANMFGSHGFKVALISRSTEKLNLLVHQLAHKGVEAAAFGADVYDRESLVTALRRVKERFGHIDVLEFSPSDPGMKLAPATQLTYETVQKAIDFQIHGAIAAANEVIPEMIHRGGGTILFTTGASSVHPEIGHEWVANYGVAAAGLRNWAHALHASLGPKGVQVAHIAIGVFIGQEPEASAEAIAPLYWELHNERDEVERVFMLQK